MKTAYLLWLRRPWLQQGLLSLVALALMSALWWALIAPPRPADTPYPLGPYNQERCPLPGEGSGTFKVLVISQLLAKPLAQALCHEPALTGRFAQVEVSWQARGELSAADIMERRYQLLWNRDYVLTGLVPRYHQYLAELLALPDYQVYLLGREPVVLNPAAFAGKRLGLLSDSESQSGYQLPLHGLNDAGIKPDPGQLRFFRERRQLQAALAKGDVDFITAIAAKGHTPWFDPAKALLIAGKVPAGAWFIDSRLSRDKALSETLVRHLEAAMKAQLARPW